ncbi:MAG: HD domain-containing protein, partial [Candidatus Uhrbacteria bacterium]|nr:HD domain-containing protein [Candidatus Uhrbacteria bacterium]
ENQPEEIQREAAKFEFDQKFDSLNLDQKMLTVVGQNIDRYRQLIEDNFEMNDREKINTALLQMLQLHKDQKDRPDGMPYISHPLEVSRTVVEDFGVKDSELIIASLLHDSVEDQGMKLAKVELETRYGEAISSDNFEEEHKDEIRALALSIIAGEYGDRVASIINKLSNPDFDEIAKQDTDPADKESFQAKKHSLYKEHVAEAIQDPDVLVVKLADYLHNFTNVDKLPESPQKEKLRNKYMPVMPVFRDRMLDESKPMNIPNSDTVIRRLEEAAIKLSHSK